jgi:hypothetical protein
MSERGGAGERNLTGIWNGLYTYPHGQSTAFVATLIETAGSLSGTTHEPNTSGDAPGTTLLATLSGSRRDSAVTFTKRYDPPGPRTGSPVRYEGALNADGTEIEGRWIIAGMWSGKFLMIRSAGQETTVSRKVSERV